MKKIFLLFAFLCFTKNFAQDYAKKWDLVIESEKKGLVKQAQRQVDKIYKKAVSSNNETQIIKCFFYQSKYIQTLEEQPKSKIITNLRLEISKASIPSKAILNLIYARCLKTYFDQNRYKLVRRTAIDSLAADDFLTWTKEDFDIQLKKRYDLTLANETVLKNTKLSDYEALFDFFSDDSFKHISLFDFMASESISFYQERTDQFLDNASEYENQSEILFASSKVFITANLDFVKDENAHKVLRFYQKLEAEHAFSEYELARIQFCNSYLLKQNNTYEYALDRLQKKVSDKLLLQKILYEKAIAYNGLASLPKFPDYNIKAIGLLDSILDIKNRSNTYKKALILKNNITQRELFIKIESYAYNKQQLRAFINYKNADSLRISYYKINLPEYKDLQNFKLKDSVSNVIQKRRFFASSAYTFADKKDYLSHSTEILLPPLEIGMYMANFESFGNSSIGKSSSFELVTISDLSAMAMIENSKTNNLVVNRKTGIPVENVTITNGLNTAKTDHNGLASYANGAENQSNRNDYVSQTYTKEKDTLFVSNTYIYENHSNSRETSYKAKVNFYLDRAIYRPGQTVFYKGIAISNKNKINAVVPKLLLKVIMEDANGETIKELDVTTNEFGSFFGKFELPKSGLTGEFTISAAEPDHQEKDPLYDVVKDEHPFWDNANLEYSMLRFKVEEYKRPTFEVTFQIPTETFVIGDTIKLTGRARAFAGNNIANAKVYHTIKRDFYDLWSYSDAENAVAIATDSLTTDDSGNFSIKFIAAADLTLKKETLPIFNYTINARVTDINGESHDADSRLKIGYQSLFLKAEIPKIVSTSESKNIILNSTNSNGQFVPTEGNLEIWHVADFRPKFKNRLWGKPEIERIGKDEFEKLFPYENYGDEISNKRQEKLVYSKKVNTGKTLVSPIDFISSYQSGYYRLVFKASDRLNNPVETDVDFQIRQAKDQKKAYDELFILNVTNKNPVKDGFAIIEIHSSVPEMYLTCGANHENTIAYQNNVKLKNYAGTIKIPIPKNSGDFLNVWFETIFENEHFSRDLSIPMKQQSSDISIETATFRDKIVPGKTESWSFKIKNSGKNTPAEVLAAMYDSSLDQFYTSDWENPQIINYYYNGNFQKTPIGFGQETVSLRNLNPYFLKPEMANESVRLMWFGFDFNNANNPLAKKIYEAQMVIKTERPVVANLISGIVSEGGLPIPTANVTVKGTSRSTQTDFDGYYQINAVPGEELVVSFIGYKDQLVAINRSVIDIELSADSMHLGEVVVTAQGISRQKKSLGYAVQNVENDNSILNDKLSGKIAGINVVLRGYSSMKNADKPLYVVDGIAMDDFNPGSIKPEDIENLEVIKGLAANALYGTRAANGVVVISTKKALQELSQVKARSNRNETAFFYPDLKTDLNGKIHFSFTTPESLTSWKLRLLAHNKNTVSGYLEKTAVTQKQLMVFPNMPRFLREKDTIIIFAKISNLTTSVKNGIAILQLSEAATMQNVDQKMYNDNGIRNFSIAPSGNTTVSWKIYVPEAMQGLQYKIVAKSGDFSDGEESILPVLTNNILVTESIALWVKGKTKKQYVFGNLKNNTSETLKNHRFSLEYTSNPIWLAIESLPYLMEYEHECTEQTFARYYANALAGEIINSNPKIGAAFKQRKDSGKMLSKLEQNPELKSLITAETPWLRDAQSETEKNERLALLFDLENMKNSQKSTFDKLMAKQKTSGGFAWFDGGKENDYITSHIIAGIGHLQKLKVKDVEACAEILKTAIPYLDAKFSERISPVGKYTAYNNSDLHYLYSRSFFLQSHPLSEKRLAAINLQLENLKENWLDYSIYEKGLAALTLYRFGQTAAAKKVLVHLKETASNNEDWGMYWTQNTAGFYWSQAPIETQALLIEAFSEIDHDTKSEDAMKVWLLKNKQSKNWPTTKSTTEAVYALLLNGSNWLESTGETQIKIGNNEINGSKLAANKTEANAGYLKIDWKPGEIDKEMASVSIENKSEVPGFGGLYWQYFEDLDKIKSSEKSVLSVRKELYLKKNTANGPLLENITTLKSLSVGNIVTIRLIVTSTENIDYVHLKDMRASCFEPLSVISGYQWQDSLGYYKSTKDAATHFFFDKIDKGTYILEYDMIVNNQGEFSNGITTIESMYAPEFTSHTKGIRLKVVK